MSGRVWLEVVAGPIQGRRFEFQAHDTFLFGRAPDCHAGLPVNDTTASRHHFLLEVNPPAARLRDLGSLNGTWVNGAKFGGRVAGHGRLWTYAYEGAALRFFIDWLLSLRWQRLPAFKKLARTLYDHLEGILAYCEHKVPFGVVEAINGNSRALIRRGRGYRDHEYLTLKAQKSTAQARLARAA